METRPQHLRLVAGTRPATTLSPVAYISTDFIGCAFFCHNTPKGQKSFSRVGTQIWMGMRVLKDAVTPSRWPPLLS